MTRINVWPVKRGNYNSQKKRVFINANSAKILNKKRCYFLSFFSLSLSTSFGNHRASNFLVLAFDKFKRFVFLSQEKMTTKFITTQPRGLLILPIPLSVRHFIPKSLSILVCWCTFLSTWVPPDNLNMRQSFKEIS